MKQNRNNFLFQKWFEMSPRLNNKCISQKKIQIKEKWFLPYCYNNVGDKISLDPAQGSVWFSKKLKWKNKRLSRISCFGNSMTPVCIRTWEELHRLTYDNYFANLKAEWKHFTIWKPVEVHLDTHLKFNSSSLEKCINISRVKRFLSKCVIFVNMYDFLKTSKNKALTQKKSWSSNKITWEDNKNDFRIYICLSVFSYTEKKIVHSERDNHTMLILLFFPSLKKAYLN